MGTFCGTTIPKQVRSSGQYLYMTFHSDGSVTKRGFMGKYKSVRKGCDMYHTDFEGICKSPNYPKNYDNNMDCIKSFKAREGEIIELTMEDFEVEYNSNCAYDYVTVYDGKDEKAPKMGTFCGTTIPKQVRSSGQYLYMTFHSDGSVTKRGFMGKYKSVKKVDKPKQTCGRTIDDRIGQIVGGSDTIIRKHPRQVLVMTTRKDKTYNCGGSIIAKNWIMTAAHCTDGVAGVKDLMVVAGITNRNEIESNVISVKNLIQHPGYKNIKDGPALNDIALIEINGEFDLTKDNTRAVCLAEGSDTTTFDGKKCVVTGWGRTTEGGQVSQTLQEVYLEVASKSQCLKVGTAGGLIDIDLVVDSHICAGYLPGGLGSCHGDSGGPLVCKRPDGTNVVAGVVSFATGCARRDQYTYFTRVSHYAKWIADNMKDQIID